MNGFSRGRNVLSVHGHQEDQSDWRGWLVREQSRQDQKGMLRPDCEQLDWQPEEFAVYAVEDSVAFGAAENELGKLS